MTVIPMDAPRSDDGQWWWDGTQWQPVTAVATPGSPPPVEETRSLPSLRRSGQGWLLTVKGVTDAGTMTGVLWPNGAPAEVSVAEQSVNQNDQIATFQIQGLTMATVQTMEASWANWFAQEVMFPEEPQGGGGPEPQVPADVPMDAEKAESEWKTWISEGTHTVLEFASWFVEEGSRFLTFFEGFAGPVGDVLMLYDLFSAVIEAFQEELKDEQRHGYVFGMIWQVMGLPDVQPQMEEKEPWAVTPGLHSFEEHAAAFNEGVQEGRRRIASDLVLHNAIAGRIAYHMVKEHSTEGSAAQDTLTELAAAAGWTDPFQLFLNAPQVR